MSARLSPPRRIVTANLPLPSHLQQFADPEPAVQVISESVIQHPELDGNAYRATVYTHDSLPTDNGGTDVIPREIPNNGIVISNGANIRFNDLAPGQVVPMHRTQTTDYNVIIIGELYLITPEEPISSGERLGRVKETLCVPGDVIVQRGTLHSWENRSSKWARSLSVMISAGATNVEIEGLNESLVLPDLFLAAEKSPKKVQ